MSIIRVPTWYRMSAGGWRSVNTGNLLSADPAVDALGSIGTLRKIGQPGIISIPSGGGGRVADSLNTANTGVPAGTSLTDLAGMTLTSANNGGSQTNKRITSLITLSGVSNYTFTNCHIDFHNWFQVIGDASGKNAVKFDHCTFQASASPGTTDCTMIDASGVWTYRCRFLNWDNAFRMRSNCTMEECWVTTPSNIPGAHVDGIEMYGSQSGSPCFNNHILRSHIDPRYFSSGTYGVGTGSNSSVTAPVNCTCDFSSTDGIVVEGNNLFGGSFNCYYIWHPSSPSRVPTNIESVDNHHAGYNDAIGGVPVTIGNTSVGVIKYWEDNIDKGGNSTAMNGNTPYPIPGLGIDRPRP